MKKLIILFLFFFFSASSLEASKRIVCLTPSLTEMVYVLGAGKSIVGVTTYSNYPLTAKQKPRIGTFNHPSLETIIKLKPDLVFALEKANPPQVISRLKNLNFSVIVLKNGGIETIYKNLLTIGKILNKEDRAIALINEIKNELDNLERKRGELPKPKVFWQIGLSPLISCGKVSYHHELITLAGGLNILSKEKTAYPVYSLERVFIAKPDIIIASSMSAKKQIIKTFWKQFPKLPAVKKNKIYIVDSDLFDRPSPRVIKAVKTLILILHPEVKLAP
jgi:iron complex transport system substrate-binding protein